MSKQMTGKQLQQILNTMSEADLDNEILIEDSVEEYVVSILDHDHDEGRLVLIF